MKKYIQLCVAVCLVLCFCVSTTLAATSDTQQTKETIVFDDGSYLEIVTTVEHTTARSNTKKAAKEYIYKTILGEKVCQYVLYGTFSYDGKSSEAVSTVAEATIYQSGWSLKSHKEYCSGNRAYGTAAFSGPSGSKTLGGFIACDKNGNIT